MLHCPLIQMRGVSWKLPWTIVSAITPSGFHAPVNPQTSQKVLSVARRRINYPFLHNIVVYQPSNYVNNAAWVLSKGVLWLTLIVSTKAGSNSPSVSWAIISIIQSSAASESPRYALVPPPIQPCSPGNQTWWIFDPYWDSFHRSNIKDLALFINSNSVKSVLDDRAQDSVMKLIFLH